MKDAVEILQALQDTPVPNLLVIAGLILLFLAFIGKFGTYVEVPEGRQKWAGGLGVLFFIFGIGLFLVPALRSDPLPSPVPSPTPETATMTPIPPTDPPVEAPTEMPTPTPTNTTAPTQRLTATVKPTETPTTVSVVSAEQAVRDYYSAINRRQYNLTWSILSPHFKSIFNCCNSNGDYDFDSYVNFWDSVERVDTGDVRVIQQNDSTATVYAQLSYLYKTGNRVSDSNPYIKLVFDTNTRTWLFYDKGRNP